VVNRGQYRASVVGRFLMAASRWIIISGEENHQQIRLFRLGLKYIFARKISVQTIRRGIAIDDSRPPPLVPVLERWHNNKPIH
jgi:hypothetical protein